MKKRGSITIIIIAVIIIAVVGAGVGIYYFTNGSCTAEAKVCPDGSTVGRNPLLGCEFDPCPDFKECSELEEAECELRDDCVSFESTLPCPDEPGIVCPTVMVFSHCADKNQSIIDLSDSVIDANNKFALDLYLKYKSKEGNLFFSPYSISSALAMTYEGAKGKTAEEMQAVLHLPESKEKIRSDFVEIYNELNKEDKSYKLTTANALWAQEDYPFEENYFNTVEEYYSGKVTNLNFKTDLENSRVTINNWVEDKTEDKIKDLIPKGILSDLTRLVLTNAIYFKANWSDQFDAEDTRDGKFTLIYGDKVDVKMMNKESNFNYGETNDLKILEMNYLGEDLSMLIILPNLNSPIVVEETLSKENIEKWKEDMKTEKVIVSLPKFKFETKYFMAKDLKEMGMPTAFTWPGANFTGMSSTGELVISEVIHQTFVEVAEYGTEAAAATAVVMEVGASPPVDQPEVFNADHPFIFIIQQKDTGNILFIGRVSDPTQE